MMMNQKTSMVANLMNSSKIKTAFAIFVALTFAFACTSTTAYAKKKHKVKYGQVELATNPGGFPLRIDGKPQGDTSTTVRVIELEPGHHNVEILLPNGGRWVRDFDIEAGRKVCVNLNYHPKKYTVTKPPQSPCPYPVNISAPVSVNDGDLILCLDRHAFRSAHRERRRHRDHHCRFHRSRQPEGLGDSGRR